MKLLKGERDDVERDAATKQELHTENNLNEGIIREYLDMLLPQNWDSMDLDKRRGYIHGELPGVKRGEKKRIRVCAMEVWMELMNGESKELTQMTSRELHLYHLAGFGEQ